MKLRLNGDSIRIRVGPAEVRQVAQGQPLVARTRFAPGATLTVTLSIGPAEATAATFDGRDLRVTLPAPAARRWAAADDQVSVGGTQDAGDGRRLSIVVEKDFECLHGEQEGEAFPHPGGRGSAATPAGA